jgi:hypothetical protein
MEPPDFVNRILNFGRLLDGENRDSTRLLSETQAEMGRDAAAADRAGVLGGPPGQGGRQARPGRDLAADHVQAPAAHVVGVGVMLQLFANGAT